VAESQVARRYSTALLEVPVGAARLRVGAILVPALGDLEGAPDLVNDVAVAVSSFLSEKVKQEPLEP